MECPGVPMLQVLRRGRQRLLCAAGAALPRRPAAALRARSCRRLASPAAVHMPVHGGVRRRRNRREAIYKCAKGGATVGGAGVGGAGDVRLGDEGGVQGGGDGGERGGVLRVANVPGNEAGGGGVGRGGGAGLWEWWGVGRGGAGKWSVQVGWGGRVMGVGVRRMRYRWGGGACWGRLGWDVWSGFDV